MKTIRTFILALSLTMIAGCQTTLKNSNNIIDAGDSYVDERPATVRESGEFYVFGWGMWPSALAKPTGGTTHGAAVIPGKPIPVTAAQAGSDFEKDRAAILALAGDYKVDFHFMETLGLTMDFEPRHRYNSWGTEHIHVLDDLGGFISLQHTLVMFFEDENGVSDAMVMKHWRQDWTYEDEVIYTFKGDLTWDREELETHEVAGKWTQAVFQVDDSPRYEVVGEWEHRGNLSRWVSQSDARPLPRREFSQRSDYQVLEGEHQIILTPTGWVHEQINWKRQNKVTPGSVPLYLSQEIGINRYERIIEPDLSAPAEEYWQQSGDYWSAVRDVWRDLMSERELIELHDKVNGQSQFMVHFQNAESTSDVRQSATNAVMSFLK